MNHKVATALALALMAGASLSLAPLAAAVDCTSYDFSIPAVKPLTARTLAASASEIGATSVMASLPKMLNVELSDPGSAGVLAWSVYHVVGSTCQQYTDGGCGTGNVLDKASTVQCTLDAPGSGSETYWVLFEETGGHNGISYFAWASA